METTTAEAKARLEELERQRAHELAVENIRAEAARATAMAAVGSTRVVQQADESGKIELAKVID